MPIGGRKSPAFNLRAIRATCAIAPFDAAIRLGLINHSRPNVLTERLLAFSPNLKRITAPMMGMMGSFPGKEMMEWMKKEYRA